MENIKQALIELIADFLDRDEVEIDQAIAGIRDPQEREETELHLRMAEAAFQVYMKSVVSTSILA